jgi:gliding motility-associated-like protein
LKKTFILHTLLFLALFATAQKQNNTWYFGKGAGIDFNYTPPKALKGGNVSSVEGCASLSDNNGHILFYTNGEVIYNRKNDIMLNGSGLAGDQSSTNNVAIVPLPNNDSLFYLFATSAALSIDQQFTYSIINIKGDGGYGEVIQKNVSIEPSVFEKLAAIKHCDSKQTWLIVRKWETDEYHAYLLTAAGLNMVPVVSHTGLVIGGYDNNAIGTLKSSVKGDKLVALHAFQNDIVELMDFDNTTGMITNPIQFKPNTTLPVNPYIGLYGAEFSPNGKLLYISSNNSLTEPSILYQFDISSNNAAAITASKQVIAKTTPWYAGSLQIGPDKKIYMAMWKDTAVSIINDPDVAGTGCNFKFDALLFDPKLKEPVQFGLPTFIQSSFDPNTAPFDFTRTGKCTDQDIQFTISRTTGMDSVRWFFGDAQESTTLSPLHHYTGTGYYDVKLIVYKKNCSGIDNDIITRKIWIAPDEIFLGKDTSACVLKNVPLAATVDVTGANYLWSTGDVTKAIIVNDPGKYWFQVEQNGCIASDTVKVGIKTTPVVDLGIDTSVCYSKPFYLSAKTSVPATYVWNTGQSSPQILISKPGQYSVKVTGECEATDTVNIFTGDCDIFIPTAFTPNGDGKNDYFGILNDFISRDFTMQVFDRWGKPVFVSQSSTEKWDGTFKGKPMPNGGYSWIITYINAMGYTKRLKGMVLILR